MHFYNISVQCSRNILWRICWFPMIEIWKGKYLFHFLAILSKRDKSFTYEIGVDSWTAIMCVFLCSRVCMCTYKHTRIHTHACTYAHTRARAHTPPPHHHQTSCRFSKQIRKITTIFFRNTRMIDITDGEELSHGLIVMILFSISRYHEVYQIRKYINMQDSGITYRVSKVG